MTPVVELIGARKSYRNVEAVRGIDLVIRPGEIVGVLGPNGAGKTTSISLMLGLRKPSSGVVRLFGMDPGRPEARSRRGVMLQESGIPGVLTVKELVRLFTSYYPTPLSVSDAIALAGLEDKAEARAARLSGGERQRLYYALAICGDPEALFLDEPTAGMDVTGRRAFLAGVKESAKRGKTVVLTTHYHEEADAVAERIVVIDRGRVIADGSPQDIKSRVPRRRISFYTTGPLTESILSGLPVQEVHIVDGRVTMLTNTAEAVVRELFDRGVTIQDLEVAGASLEEAFMTITGAAGGA